MKRDDDLLRELLLEIEAHDDPLFMFSLSSDLDSDERVRYYHLKLLADAGLLSESSRGGMWRITNAGHDFLELTRSNETWAAVKGAASSLGGASIKLLGEIALGLTRAC